MYGFSVRRAVHYVPLRGDTYGLGFEAMLINGVLAAAAWRSSCRCSSRRAGAPRDGMTAAEARDATQVLEPTTISLIGNDDWTAQTAPNWTSEPPEQ